MEMPIIQHDSPKVTGRMDKPKTGSHITPPESYRINPEIESEITISRPGAKNGRYGPNNGDRHTGLTNKFNLKAALIRKT